MPVGPLITGKDTVDIQLHDTYFVFGNKGWMGNSLFLYLNVLLVVSWLGHLALRQNGIASTFGRWVHAGLSVALLSLLIAAHQLWRQTLLSHHYLDWFGFEFLSSLIPLSIICFVLLQLIFWASIAVLLIKKTFARLQ